MATRKSRIEFQDIYPGGPFYSRGVRAGNMLFISGTTARGSTAEGGVPIDQLLMILDRISKMVAAEGVKPSDILKLTTYVTKRADWWPVPEEHTMVYREFFGSELPTNSMIEISALVEDGLDIEIEAIAILDET